MRRVADPNGVRWNVDVSWTDIRFGEKYKRHRDARATARRERDAAKARGEERASRWWWLDALSSAPDPAWGFVGIVIVIVIVILAVLTFPWLLVLLVDLVELLFFPLIAVGIITWRVMRKRPFTITAERREERVAEWSVVGVREARRVERAVSEAVIAGGDPVELFPEYATHRYD